MKSMDYPRRKNRLKKRIVLFATFLFLASGVIKVDAAENARLTNDKSFIAMNEIGVWFNGPVLSGDTFTINPNNGTNGGLKIPYTLLDNKQNYIMTFDIQKTSGNIKSIGGQANLSNKTITYIDGKQVSGEFTNGVTYPDDTAKHSVKVEFNTNWLESTSYKDLYIQPNRAGYNYTYNAKISNVKFMRVPTSYSMGVKTTEDTKNDAIDVSWNKITKSNEPYLYKVFQQKPGSVDYQSVSSNDLTKQVKVLNVYPDVTDKISYTTWNGTKRTNIAKSAAVEMWMETPNAKNAKGYGMGLIDVEPVSLASFNANPSNYMKNSDGTYKYDVVFFGSWDENGSSTASGDLSDKSLDIMKPYMDSGRGVLIGHDTILGYTGKPHPNFNSIRNYVNIATNIDDNAGANNIGSTKVQLQKKGLLTNYPWDIGDIGDVLTIPLAHSTNQVARGDVWLTFHDYLNDASNPSNRRGPETGDANGNGTNNFYLTTWNNAAMIQTGHSFGAATEDEQKILANTIFYLTQLTTSTSIKDRSANDKANPTFSSGEASYSGSETSLSIDFPSAIDKGSTYKYYVEGVGQNTNEIFHSEEISNTITSGLKGYSYVLDNSATTIPDNKVELTTPKLTYNSASNTSTYLHVVAVDNMGNTSAPMHIKVNDVQPPTIAVTGNPTAWTGSNVTLTVSGSDAFSGVKSITLPDGSVVAKNADKGVNVSSTFTVSANGSYTFKLTDYYGNVATSTVVVSKIDKTLPGLTVSSSNTAWTNQDIVLTGTATDTQSGVESVTLPNATVVAGTKGTQTISANGTYTFKAKDNVGNTSSTSLAVTNIDKAVPTGTITGNPTSWTNSTITLTINAADTGGSGLKSIKKPDGTTVTTASTTYAVSANGTYSFVITDNAGNTKTISETVTKIDKALPTGTITGNPTVWTNDNAALKLTTADTGGSGYYRTKLPDGTFSTSATPTYTATANGTFSFVIYDNAGNSNTVSVSVTKIDKTLPGGTVTGNPTAWTNANATLTISATDTGGAGVKSITKPDGTIVNATSTTYVVTANGTYNFIVTDNAGNTKTISEVVTKIDKALPDGTITGNPTNWTNQNVTLSFSATDTGGAGVKSITKPDGTVVNASTTTFAVSTNGTYNFVVTDNAGNTKTMSISVTKIDKVIPGGAITGNPTAWTNANATLTISATDTGGAGVKSITKPDGTIVASASTTYVVTANGTYNFVVTDNAGNTKIISETVTKIDKVLPDGSATGNPTDWTNQNVTLMFSATDSSSGVKSIKKPDGTTVTTSSTTYVVSTNGTYDFVITDNAGNIKTVSIVVSKIDKTTPGGTITGNSTAWTNKDVVLTIKATDSGGAGVKSIKKPDNTTVTTDATTYTATANGTYSFVITDNAGNTTTISETVNRIDKTLPTLALVQTPTSWTNGDVTLTATGSDTGGAGVKSITLPNGTVKAGATGSQIVTENGTYEFKVTDNAGNEAVKSITVSNIDKLLPNGTITGNPTAWTNKDVVLTINGTDTGGSGVKSIKKPDNSIVNSASTTFIVSENGIYNFTISDTAGNEKIISVTVSKIDKLKPTLVLSQTPETWTNGNVTINATGSDTGGSGVESITLPNGNVISGSKASQIISDNGTFTFTIRDNAGNIFTQTIVITNIDKVKPVGTVTPSTTSWTNKDIVLTVAATDASSGIKSIKLPNNTIVNASKTTFTVTKNGAYSFVITDNAGNEIVNQFTVGNIDKVEPTEGTIVIE